MILKYYLPNQEFSWEELERLSAKEPGRATWPQQMLVHLKEKGFDILVLDDFNEHEFIKNGANYLKAKFGEEIGTWQATHSDLTKTKILCENFLAAEVKKELRIPSLDDVKYLLDSDYLLTCVVNSKRLNNQEGYQGHSVVIYNIDDSTVIIHDPGLPAVEAQQIPRQGFFNAWSDHGQNLIAVKR